MMKLFPMIFALISTNVFASYQVIITAENNNDMGFHVSTISDSNVLTPFDSDFNSDGIKLSGLYVLQTTETHPELVKIVLRSQLGTLALQDTSARIQVPKVTSSGIESTYLIDLKKDNGCLNGYYTQALYTFNVCVKQL